MFPVNPAIISMLIKGKLDDIITGKPMDGFKIASKDEKQIILIPEDTAVFEGIEISTLVIVFNYKNIEFVITNQPLLNEN